MNRIKIQMGLRWKRSYVLWVLVFSAALLPSHLLVHNYAGAAGSSVVSVEASPASVTPGGNVTLRFYVTPSGASVNSVSVNVALTNLSYVSYSATGSAFNGLAQVPSGATATSFSVIGAYQSFGGSGSKALILTVTVKASSSPGTGQVSLSGAEAYDTSEAAMSATVQNASITISAPADTDGGDSGGGSSGGGSGSSGNLNSGGGSSQNSSGGNDTSTSNDQQNKVVVPGSQAGPDVPGVEMSETEFIAAADDIVTTANEKDGALTGRLKSGSRIALLSVLLFAVAGAAFFIRIVITRIYNAGGLRGKVSGAIVGGDEIKNPQVHAPHGTTITPTNNTPSISHAAPHSPTPAVSPEDHPSNHNGPTIIRPQQ